jgi:ATP-dependent helicase/DNAse subunit B
MPANVHVLVGPAGCGKTTALLARLRELLRRDLGGALWLSPTRRALDDLRGRIVSTGGACGLQVQTFSDVAGRIIAANGSLSRPISAAQRRLLVEELVSDLAERGELPHFGPVCDTGGFVEGLLALLQDLQREGVSAEALTAAAVRRKDRECALLFTRYQEELQRQGLHDQDGREAEAARVLRKNPTSLSGLSLVIVDGFSDFTPAQHALLREIAEQVVELWISLPDEAGDERAELFSSPRVTCQSLQCLSPGIEWAETVADPTEYPTGLAHLRQQLFRPLRRVERSTNASGVGVIEAPGMLGEVRLVARRIKTLLLRGVQASAVLVTARDIGPYADLLREVFDEYGLPLDLEGGDPLIRQPAVTLLLRALRLPEDDFPFAGVTAVLRHTFFRPEWPEMEDDDLIASQAEALLRLLGEPRGRTAYLAAVARWAEREQPGLEDEAAEESRRKRIHELARKCQAFLERFFHVWNSVLDRATLERQVAAARNFADDLGIARACGARNLAALASFWSEVDTWLSRPRCAGRTIDRRTFLRRLTAVACSTVLPRSSGTSGHVRILPAEQARHLQTDYLFVLGLGERSFPRMNPEPTLLDDADRAALDQTGAILPPAGDALPGEMLLFFQVIAGAREQLVLSYPAVDERGQQMLPASFLLAVRDCFTERAIPVERREMLLDRRAEDTPLSSAEYRIAVAAAWPEGSQRLEDDLGASLADVSQLVQRRFRQREFGPHDGLFRDPLLIEWVGKQLGPQKVFSPTALESYISCPFRFFLQHVLELEPLEEPSEEIEVTRRGMAVHRALARLHSRLKAEGVHAPTERVTEEVLREFATAVDEDVARAPSPGSKTLWRLEGQRLLRVARKYTEHWSEFVEPWQKRGVAPRPHLFEVDFGLPPIEGQPANAPLVISVEEVEVRISGRIDRVDLAELEDGTGFWVIDYKTGRSEHYTTGDLAQYRRLQLTLYALAVECVLLEGQNARPLGLAYWMVSEKGPKVVLPGRSAAQWFDDAKRWPAIREQLRHWVARLVSNIRRGAFPLAPRSETCTETCPFGQVCRITQARSVGKTWDLPLPNDSTASN